jgi:hypothetical protein
MTTQPPETLPRGVRLAREYEDGVLVFEHQPVGSLKKQGGARVKELRRYRWHPRENPEPPVLLPSVTTICGAVLPKPGLVWWAEEQGIRGTLRALDRSLITCATPPREAVQTIRQNGLGMDAARDQAAGRGLNIHALLEQYMASGQVPNPAEHPETDRPFIQGLVRWLLAADPEPQAVELLVCDPDRGYAGRADLICTIAGQLTLVDLKTSPARQIYDAAHLQVRLLSLAEERHGTHRPQRLMLVAVDEHGAYREMDCVCDPAAAGLAVEFYRHTRPLAAGCEQANRSVKQTIKGRQ